MRLKLAALWLLAATVPAHGATVLVHAFNNDYGINPPAPSDPIIELNDTVRWVVDAGIHSSTSGDGQLESWDSELMVFGDTFDHTFTNLGSFGYYCSLHGFDLGGGQVGGMAGYVHVANAFKPTSFTIVRGQLKSGGVQELQEFDDGYLVVQRGLTLNLQEAPIQVVFTATSSILAPVVMGVSLEDGVNASGLTRRIEVFNFQTNAYEQVDQGAAQLADKTTVVSLSGQVNRFVNQASGEVRVKVSYLVLGPVTNPAFQARFDRVAALVL